MSDQSSDPVVQQFREQISDTDLAILDALNKRLALVQRLHAYKTERGYDVLDASREGWILAWISRNNRGPLGAEAVEELFRHLLELTTREAARINAESTTTAS